MTVTAVQLTASDVQDGCTGCGSQATVQLSPYLGRRCSRHAVLPMLPTAGPYRRSTAMDLVDLGHPRTAFLWLADSLAAEVERRFDDALVSTGLSVSGGLW